MDRFTTVPGDLVWEDGDLATKDLNGQHAWTETRQDDDGGYAAATTKAAQPEPPTAGDDGDPKAPTPPDGLPEVPATTGAWPGWAFDLELASVYTDQVTQAFGTAIDQAGVLLLDWWTGALAATRQGLTDLISDLVGSHVGATLRRLWTEAWHLGSGSARAVARQETPDWGEWTPGDIDAARLVESAQGLQTLLAAHGITTIRAIASTGMPALATEISDAVGNGDSWETLAKRLPQILSVPQRAPMIARTEIARAVSAATLDQYKDHGVSRKEWAVAPDERVCPICLKNEEAGAIPSDSLFPSGDLDPPGHPNCRCALMPAEVHGFDITGAWPVPVVKAEDLAGYTDVYALAQAEIAKALDAQMAAYWEQAAPDLVKVGPEGYIHGYVCVRPPCGEKPGRIEAGDLDVAADGGIVHRQTGWAIGHLAPGEHGLVVAHHANGAQTSHEGQAAALRSVARGYNRRAGRERPAAAAPDPATPAAPAREATPAPAALIVPATAWQHEEPTGEGDEETAKRLTAALKSGLVKSDSPSTTGIQGQTSIETFGDGSRWVHKVYPSGESSMERFQSQAYAIHDLLASRVSDAVGADTPHIVRTGPREVYMPFVGDATPAAELPGSMAKAMSTPAGARIGVFDAITGHSDRHAGNVLIARDGTPVPIDNNNTWEVTAEDGTGRLFNSSPFTEQLIEELTDGNTPISSAELDEIVTRMQAARPAFDQAARELGTLSDDDAEYATDFFPDELFAQTTDALTRIRDWAADNENGAGE